MANFIQKITGLFTNTKKQVLKYLSTNKTFISAVIKYMAMAYTEYNGKQKMEQAIKFLFILVKINGIAGEYSDDLAKLIEDNVQKVYNDMKAKGLLV